MKVKEIMSKDVVSLSPDTTVGEAVRIFADRSIGGAPVIGEDDRILGIVTDADVFRNLRVKYKEYDISFPSDLGMTSVEFTSEVRYQELSKAFKDLAETRISSIMVKKVLTCSPDDLVEMVVPTLVDNKINRLPVEKDGRVVGLVSRGDIIKALLLE